MHNQKIIELQLCEFISSVHTLKPFDHRRSFHTELWASTEEYKGNIILCGGLYFVLPTPFFDSLIIYLSFLASVSTVLPPQKRYQLSRETRVRCMLKQKNI